jgi:hypothetical protein
MLIKKFLTKVFITATILATIGITIFSPLSHADECPYPPRYIPPEGGIDFELPESDDALFEAIYVPGLMDRDQTASAAFVDVTGNGLPDIYLTDGSSISLFINEGCFQFREEPIFIDRNPTDGLNFNFQILATADFNDDGYPDFYISSNGINRRAQLLISHGSYSQFKEVAVPMGVANLGAYVRGQLAIGDVTGNGYLDIAVGAEQIGAGTALGRPLSRLYIYHPSDDGIFENGHFESIDGTDLVPDFGGVKIDECNPYVDRSVSAIMLRDLDNDGDLDMVQVSQCDMNPIRTQNISPDDPCATGNWRFGVFAWQNQLVETGTFKFEKVKPGNALPDSDDDNILPEEGQMSYDFMLGYYTPIRRAMSGYVLGIADTNNTGRLDILTAVSTDTEWQVQSEYVGSKFWRNDGDWQFADSTEESGLNKMNWNYGQWAEFWGWEAAPESVSALVFCDMSFQKPLCENLELADHNIMPGGIVFGDVNNNGWIDFIYVNRHGVDGIYGFGRDVLFLNLGDGMYRPTTTDESGLAVSNLAGELIDLNGNGHLDYYQIARPGGSGQLPGFPVPTDAGRDRVWANVAGLRGVDNASWLNVGLKGRPYRKLIGAKVFAFDSESGKFFGRRDYFTHHSYKSTRDPNAHFGLAQAAEVTLIVELPQKEVRTFCSIPTNQRVNLDVQTGNLATFDEPPGRLNAGRIIPLKGKIPSCLLTLNEIVAVVTLPDGEKKSVPIIKHGHRGDILVNVATDKELPGLYTVKLILQESLIVETSFITK